LLDWIVHGVATQDRTSISSRQSQYEKSPKMKKKTPKKSNPAAHPPGPSGTTRLGTPLVEIASSRLTIWPATGGRFAF
jgi:hypothetical protein